MGTEQPQEIKHSTERDDETETKEVKEATAPLEPYEKRRKRKYKSADDIKAAQINMYGDLATATKKCPHCVEPKALSEFGLQRANRDGLKSQCKVHQKMKAPPKPAKMPYRKAYHQKRRKKLQARTVEEIKTVQNALYTDLPNASKSCSQCGKTYLLSEFYPDTTDDGLAFRCKTCMKQNNDARREQFKTRDDEEIEEIQIAKYGPEQKKACSQCKQKRDLEQFGSEAGSKDGLNPICKVCVKDIVARRTALQVPLFNQLKSQPCAECKKYYPPAAMDWAHLPGTVKLRTRKGKPRGPGTLGRQNPNSTVFQEEMLKMRLLCANCHAMETYISIKRKTPHYPKLQAGYDIMNAAKRERKCCIDCKLQVILGFECIFDLDHRPGEVKVDSVSRLVKFNDHEKLIKEIGCCDLRCKNCHRIVTHYTRKGKPIPVVHPPSEAESKEGTTEDIDREETITAVDDTQDILEEFGAWDSDQEEEQSKSANEEETTTRESNNEPEAKGEK